MSPDHRRAGPAWLVALLVGLAALMSGGSGVPTWVDRAFVPVRYAFSFSWGRAGRLPGQEESTMGFLDSLWVAALTGIHSLGAEPVRALPYVCIGAATVCIAALAGDAWRRFGTARALLPAVSLAFAVPLVLAARSGTNDAWLAAWTAVALVAAGRDVGRSRLRWPGVLAVTALGLCGPLGWLAAAGVLWVGIPGSWRPVAVAGTVQLGVALALGFDAPTALLVDLRHMDASRVGLIAESLPILTIVGAAGIASAGTGHPVVRFALWVSAVWLVRGAMGVDDVAPAADRFLPAIAVMAWLATEAVARIRRTPSIVAVALLLIGVDTGQAWADRSMVARERRIALKESQAMARFLKWRFDKPQRVALHSAGSIAYHYGGPVIDASGRTERRDVSPEAIVAMGPEAMVPAVQYVGQTVTFTPMFPGSSVALTDAYDHHSVQHQPRWGLTQAHPIFFQYLTRKDLPRLPMNISEEDGNRFPKQ